jgi:hypothetical protein
MGILLQITNNYTEYNNILSNMSSINRIICHFLESYVETVILNRIGAYLCSCINNLTK